MSTSIYSSFNMGYKSVTRKNRTMTEKVKRALFGNVDHDANRLFLEQQLNQEYSRSCHKWNFNFREEIPIDGDGDYVWTPPSPIGINRKRKPVEIVDTSSAYYFQPIEGSTSSHILEPLKPVARSPDLAKRSSKQSLITDYMPKSKRPVVCLVKETVEERPNKIPKLGSFCSS